MIRSRRCRRNGKGVRGVRGEECQLERQQSDVSALAPLRSFCQSYGVSTNRIEASPRIESRR